MMRDLRSRREPGKSCWLLAGLLAMTGLPAVSSAAPVSVGRVDPAVAALAAEVRGQGWIAYGARSPEGDWDLFLCRPDGSGIHPLTRTPELNEFSPQFSRDGRKLLYRRLPRSGKLDNNHHGEQGELVLANADGSSPVVLGKPGELPLASFNPDGKQIASLSIRGMDFWSIDRRAVVRTLPDRKSTRLNSSHSDRSRMPSSA